jgi:hypothetical protein
MAGRVSRVVIGQGPEVWRAAGVLASRGERVLLLDDGPSLESLRGFSFGAFGFRMGSELLSGLDNSLGAWNPISNVRMGISLPQRVLELPLSTRDRVRLLQVGGLQGTLPQLVRRRADSRLRELMGGGEEERTANDWANRRFGARFTEAVFEPYWKARFALPGSRLAASLGRRHHFLGPAGQPHAPEGGETAFHARCLSAVRAAGGEHRRGAVARLHVDNGRVGSVELADGQHIVCNERPWVFADPGRIADWLGEGLPAEFRTVCRSLRAQDLHLLHAAWNGPGNLDELHLFGASSVWRAVRGEDGWTFSRTVPTGVVVEPHSWFSTLKQELGSRGLEAPQDGFRTSTLIGQVGSWGPTDLASMRDILLAWRKLGLVVGGSAGAFASLLNGEDLGLSLALAQGGSDPDLREIYRCFVEPPARVEDASASLANIVTC